MLKRELEIEGVPSIIWGSKTDKLYIAVHGNMSNKADDVITLFAEKATAQGYQVLSFDLPEHGDRKGKAYACDVWNCVHDLDIIMKYAMELSESISLFACSMGAYFSLLAYADSTLEQCLFLSPVTDMESIIKSIMLSFGINEERLKAEKEIPTPIGQTLYWDYYNYVKSHPICIWDKPTSILYGSDDSICPSDTISSFMQKFDCKLRVMEHGEHYFHTEEQLKFFVQWLDDCFSAHY